MNREKDLKFLKMIIDDVTDDVGKMQGQPFNGATVGKYFGYHAAAIVKLAEILTSLIEEKKEANNG
jgi:hypothetical protein